MPRPLLLLSISLVALAATPAVSSARGGGGDDGGRDEVRVSGSCSRGATAELRLRSRGGAIRVSVEIDHTRPGRSWRVVLVQDRRVAWRGTARTRPSGSLQVERTVRDLPGAERISARAAGPGGVTCFATASLPG